LIATAVSGETFEELLLQWNLWVRKLSNRMARRLDLEREDVYQELLFALLKAFPRFDSSLGSFGTFTGWVARAVFKRLLDRIKHSPQTVDGTFVDTEGLAASLVDVLGDPDAASPSDEANRNELIQLVRREVRRLPFRCRETIRTYFGLDGQERIGRLDKEALRRGILLLRNRIRIRPETVR
jgi:RNA polymerase sigma factor (sigma-70 family)